MVGSVGGSSSQPSSSVVTPSSGSAAGGSYRGIGIPHWSRPGSGDGSVLTAGASDGVRAYFWYRRSARSEGTRPLGERGDAGGTDRIPGCRTDSSGHVTGALVKLGFDPLEAALSRRLCSRPPTVAFSLGRVQHSA